MDMIQPQAGQLWFLKQLLVYCPARSFTELQNVKRKLYKNFSDAATAFTLSQGTSKAHICLKEETCTVTFHSARCRRVPASYLSLYR